MPASPASIPNDCFSWHTACLVDIDSPSANETNVETTHRLIQRPAMRIDLGGIACIPARRCRSCEPSKYTGLACSKKNLERGAHFPWFGGGWPVPIETQVPVIERLARRPRDLLVNEPLPNVSCNQHHLDKAVQRVS